MTVAGQPVSTLELRSRVLRGFAWSASSQLTLQISRIVVSLILARLLTPHDYGLAGMVLIFSSLVLVLTDLSLGAGLVQREVLDDVDVCTVFWTSFVVGLFLTCVVAAGAGQVAGFYHEPALRPLVQVFALNFVVSSLATAQAALLQRRMDFRGLEIRIMAGNLASGVIAIAAAAAGFGAWALIGQQLAVGVISTALLWKFTGWRPRFAYSFASLRDLGGFGISLLGTRLLYYVNRNSDNLLVGKFLGAVSLGAYSIAYNIMLLPLSRLVYPIQETLFPALARMQKDPLWIGSIWLRVNQAVAAVVMPAMLGLVVVAPDFVRVVLGARWAPAVPVIRILTVVAVLQATSALSTNILTALDRTTLLLKFAAFSTAMFVTAFVLGLHWGIVGVATAYAIANVVTVPILLLLVARVVGITLRAVAENLMVVSRAAVAMFIIAGTTSLSLKGLGVPAVLRLIATCGVGVLTYPPLLYYLAPGVIAELRGLVRNRASEGVS